MKLETTQRRFEMYRAALNMSQYLHLWAFEPAQYSDGYDHAKAQFTALAEGFGLEVTEKQT